MAAVAPQLHVGQLPRLHMLCGCGHSQGFTNIKLVLVAPGTAAQCCAPSVAQGGPQAATLLKQAARKHFGAAVRTKTWWRMQCACTIPYTWGWAAGLGPSVGGTSLVSLHLAMRPLIGQLMRAACRPVHACVLQSDGTFVPGVLRWIVNNRLLCSQLASRELCLRGLQNCLTVRGVDSRTLRRPNKSRKHCENTKVPSPNAAHHGPKSGVNGRLE